MRVVLAAGAWAAQPTRRDECTSKYRQSAVIRLSQAEPDDAWRLSRKRHPSAPFEDILDTVWGRSSIVWTLFNIAGSRA